MKLRLKWVWLKIRIKYLFGRLKGKYFCANCDDPVTRERVLEEINTIQDGKEMICQECIDYYENYDHEEYMEDYEDELGPYETDYTLWDEGY